jgi:hypothetical protein
MYRRQEFGLSLTELAVARLCTSLPVSCKRGCHPRGRRNGIRRCTASGSSCIDLPLLRLHQPIDAAPVLFFCISRPVTRRSIKFIIVAAAEASPVWLRLHLT